MKKLFILFAITAMTLTISCKKDAPVPPTPVPMAPPPAPTTTPPATPPAIPQAKDDKNTTSVSVGSEGIDINTDKTKVKVEGKGTSVEVKK